MENFVAGQIWKSEKQDAVITITDVTALETISFKIKVTKDSWEQCTEWKNSILEQFIADHDFKLEVA